MRWVRNIFALGGEKRTPVTVPLKPISIWTEVSKDMMRMKVRPEAGYLSRVFEWTESVVQVALYRQKACHA